MASVLNQSELIAKVAEVVAEIGMTHQPDNCSSHTPGLFCFDLPGQIRRGYLNAGLTGNPHYYLPNHSFAFQPSAMAKDSPVAFAKEFVGHMKAWAANPCTAECGWTDHINLILNRAASMEVRTNG